MTSPAFAADITHRRAWAVWGVAVAAYVVAVANRTSMGVAGNVATDRFVINAAQLALLPVVQLVVYAGGQVPVGLMLDRWGSRLMVAIGAAVMAVGQVILATATTLPMALLGRVLVGAGDAMTFVSVVRLVPSWFSPRRVPLLTQLTGTVGQLGQVISAIPFAAVLHTRGWTSAFGGMAAIGVVSTVMVLLVVKDQPGHSRDTAAVAARAAARADMPTTRESLKVVVREPVTWLAFWVHGMGQFSSHVIVLLWGVPYLVDGNDLSRAAASALLTLNVIVGAISGPIMGLIAGRHPRHRVTMALAVSAATAVVWAIALIPPAPRPLWQMTLLVGVTALGGPASVIAFDVVRTSTEHRFLGTATGVVNTGGFTVGLLTMLAIGVVLDWSAGGNDRGPTDYRVAMSVIVVPIVVTTVGVLVTRARARAAHPGAAL